MSLNGLDEVAVAAAHRAALAEPGGWFLLKYANRDTVELLQKGSGGVQEVRGAVERYEEKSPLYGLLQHRRKKIILKYVPEGTSRLLQVRLTVQFQSILETFTPHDTVFSFTAASELSESGLGSSMMLAPSAASLRSSSSSLRRRRLDEITEDTEEGANEAEDNIKRAPQTEEPAAQSYGKRDLDELPASAVLAKALLAKRREEAAAAAAAEDGQLTTLDFPLPPSRDGLHQKTAPPSFQLSVPPSVDKALPETPDLTPPTTSGGEPTKAPDFEATSNILLDATNKDPAEALTRPPLHSRHLSTAESDSINQWTNHVASYVSVDSKKTKRAPRPHVEAGHRPKTSGTTDSSLSERPVANLPNTIRVSNKHLLNLGVRPGSQQSTRSVPGRFVPSSRPTTGVPALPSPSHAQSLYTPAESRPAISRPASVTTEASTATPEKLRMMKALQLRKRSMLLAQRSSVNSSTTPGPQGGVTTDSSLGPHASNPSQEHLANIDEESNLAHSSTTTSPTFMTHVSEEPSTKASSYTDPDDASQNRRSLSSATSSSITPRAGVQEKRTPREEWKDDRPSAKPGLGIGTSPKTPDSDARKEKRTSARKISSPSRREAPFSLFPRDTSSSQIRSFEQSPASDPAQTSRRFGPPQPLRLVATGDTSASDVSEDELLMDALQNATVHEAKPMSVARSPVTPVMSKGSSDRLREIVTKNTNPGYQAGRSPGSTSDRTRTSSIRSTSTALPQWPPVQVGQAPVPLTKKPTLGTGISKRIKALEVLTTKETASQQPPAPVREVSGGKSAFSAFMKRSSLISNQPAPNTSTDASPPKKLPVLDFHADTRPAAEPKENTRPSIDAYASVQKGDSISVTAKIIRDPVHKHPPMSPSSSYNTPLNLFRSPLIVEHEKYDELPRDQSMVSIQSSLKSPAKSEKGRFSFSSHRSGSNSNLPRSESIHSKVSHSSTYKKHGPRSASDTTSIGEEKTKTSRTSRLMKRVSNFTSSRNKTQPTSKAQSPSKQFQEQPDPIREDSFSESLLHVVDIGDVNVQFPDSLLWKRRFIRIDDQGYIIFSPPVTDANMRSVSRKYHLSDFKQPTLPDVERQEIAWSIVLDSLDGRRVQCACESRSAQQQVLQLLVDAHSAYHQLYTGG
ncbi:hypothetical protein LTR10_014230 [Elasticomyces elasticus]|uniref:ADF-H domain-containing protein n=1 Tax=Exophiala sideris TaxID=1016849 RepID=A0ABR0JI63_9EURO|nr:hypothetical protein LTR10_014230 [Elasticomyces elasticus]KAK5034271.1 hypothetical protein LTS07_003191 [Exophiala sideris]KAK5042567.1 hypothetical protein LTR13_001414 [Exophiala sideris]KAK5065649.1 hypothetical protein LTR69_003198 [Exophiala sideris]KAK5185893.1 hypothetical protein LTR44_001942 [Eurotiomycetes sp. CCFEE 6388]